jgi:hypothetical protein
VTTFTSGYHAGAEPERLPRPWSREGTGERCHRSEGAGMAQQAMARQVRAARAGPGEAAVPQVAVRLVGALLALAGPRGARRS